MRLFKSIIRPKKVMSNEGYRLLLTYRPVHTKYSNTAVANAKQNHLEILGLKLKLW